MLSDAQVGEYLERIDFDQSVTLDKETLDRLVWQHQCTVPFQTVSLHRQGHAPSLELDDLYDKIVTRRLGGYCFELNRLFGELLLALGFGARPVLSCAVRGREGRMPINHRGILVDLNGEPYSVDVGFGGPMPAGALRMEPGPDQLIVGETFAVQKVDDCWCKVERITRANFDSYDDGLPERRQVELEICVAQVEEQDFDALNEFFSRPGTLFRDHELANLRTPDGYLGLMDTILTIRKNGEKEIIQLEDRKAVDSVLAEYFGMKGY